MTSASRHNARLSRTGMTLVEILVVLAIVGVMAGVVVLGVGAGNRGVGVETEANRLADRLRLAADDVLVTRRPLALAFDETGYQFVGSDGAVAAAEAVEALRERHEFDDGVWLMQADAAPPLTIDPDGATPVTGFTLGKGDTRWRVTFDGLNAVAEPYVETAGAVS